MDILRLKFIASLLLASLSALSTAAAQYALSSHAVLRAAAAPDSQANGDATEDAPLPQSDELGVMGAETNPSTISTPAETVIANSRLQTVARVDTQFTYDDNIFIKNRDQQSDLVFTLSPTIALGIGDVRPEFKRVTLSTFSPAVIDETYEPRSFFFVRYTPTVSVFLEHDEEDALDHDAAAEAQWQLTYLTLGSQTRFQTLSDPDIDVGGRVRRSIFSQDFTAMYDYSDSTSFEFRLGGTIRHYSTQIDSQELVMQDAVDRRLGARTAVGLAATLGWLHVEHTGSQPYEQLLVRGRYHLTEKIDLWGNAGIEFRQIERQQDRIEPVFECGAHYHPWNQTLVTLGAGRRLENSAGTPGGDIIATALDFNARQRFAERYYVGLIGSFQSARYISVLDNNDPRTDWVLLLQPYLKMDISRSAAIEVGYAFRHDDSTVNQFMFSQNRVFVHLDLLF